MRVVAPDGRPYRIESRWFPRLPSIRWRRGRLDLLDVLDLGGIVGDIPWLGAILLGLALGLVVVLVIIPAVAFALEVLVVVLWLASLLAFRVIFRRPWFIEVSTGGRVVRRYAVVGWRRARRVVGELADLHRRGETDVLPDGAKLA